MEFWGYTVNMIIYVSVFGGIFLLGVLNVIEKIGTNYYRKLGLKAEYNPNDVPVRMRWGFGIHKAKDN